MTLLNIGAAMIAAGALIGIIEALAKAFVSARAGALLAAEDKNSPVWDLLKTALAAPIANALIVLGFVAVLLGAGVLTLAVGASG